MKNIYLLITLLLAAPMLSSCTGAAAADCDRSNPPGYTVTVQDAAGVERCFVCEEAGAVDFRTAEQDCWEVVVDDL